MIFGSNCFAYKKNMAGVNGNSNVSGNQAWKVDVDVIDLETEIVKPVIYDDSTVNNITIIGNCPNIEDEDSRDTIKNCDISTTKTTEPSLQREDISVIKAECSTILQKRSRRTGFKYCKTYEQKFKKYMSGMLNMNKHSDMIIKAKTKHFFAHKVILSAGSLFFQNLFKSNVSKAEVSKAKVSTDENLTIPIKDLDCSMYSDDAIGKVLHYMYNHGQPPEFESVDDAKDIYRVSSKWKLLNLTKFCKDYLLSVINTDNALRLLEFSRECDDKNFKEKILLFMNKNPRSALNPEQVEDYVKQRPELQNELLKLLLQQLLTNYTT